MNCRHSMHAPMIASYYRSRI